MRIGFLKSMPPKCEIELDAKDIAGLIIHIAKLNLDMQLVKDAQAIDRFMSKVGSVDSYERVLIITAKVDGKEMQKWRRRRG